MKNRLFIALLSAFLLINPVVEGHDAHYLDAQPRIWQTSNGKVIGSFYLMKNKDVLIESPQGEIIPIPLNKLSKNDQQFVTNKLALIDKINQIQQKQVSPVSQNAAASQNPTMSAEDMSNSKDAGYILLGLFILVGLIRFVPKLKPLRFAIPLLATTILLTASSFTYKSMKWMGLSTRISFLDSAFSYYKPSIATRSDNNYYYVESTGLPDHETMLGITSWQQQVPIPQCYVGSNAWSIPINPTIAATPVPVNQNHFLRGAVALAVNGIPIFNPYTNTGVDAFLDGQLDQYGGHSGRADDYHYHIAPTVLYNKIPKTSPVAFALDGFAIYGDLEPDGSAQKSLDANHGHYGSDGVYHYHSSASAPYMIGNMVGTVTEDATMQIIPQAAAKGVRPALTPLKGATITHCHPYPAGNGFKLTYTLGTDKDTVDYSWTNNGDYTYKFITPAGTTTNNYKGQALCKVTVGTQKTSNPQAYTFIDPHNNIHLVLKSLSTENTNVKIYAINGQLIHKMQIQQAYTVIPSTGWPSGTYFVILNQGLAKSTNLKITLP
jgi:hypothetical protein